jgi:hypothetical protein
MGPGIPSDPFLIAGDFEQRGDVYKTRGDTKTAILYYQRLLLLSMQIS